MKPQNLIHNKIVTVSPGSFDIDIEINELISLLDKNSEEHKIFIEAVDDEKFGFVYSNVDCSVRFAYGQSKVLREVVRYNWFSPIKEIEFDRFEYDLQILMQHTSKQTNKQKTYKDHNQMMSELKRREEYFRKKLRVLDLVSRGKNCCNHCGKMDIELLTIDHVNNDGKEHRKKLKELKTDLYSYLDDWIPNNVNITNFQVLCYNCNIAKFKLTPQRFQELKTTLPNVS